jgi:putative ABC transport system permease protein
VRAAARPSGSVALYADQLAARRRAPLPSALVRLATVSSAVLLLFAVLGLALAASADAPDREASLGRLRSLGLPDRDLRRLLTGEVVTPVLVAALVGLALGAACARLTFGSLSLDLITGQQASPHPVVPWWTALAAVVLVVGAVIVTAVEWRRLRRRPLAELLRS